MLSLYQKRDNDYIPLFLFTAVVILYAAYQLYMQPNWIMNGEMWAEMATNYFHNANTQPLIKQMIATDAGYIPLPQRIIAAIGNFLGFSSAIIPYYYTITAIVFTSMMVGCFCLKPFRAIIESDLYRFVVCLCILMVADFETRTFINFTYFGTIFICFIVALSIADNKNELPWYAWLIPLLIISKPANLAVLPILLYSAIYQNTRLRVITSVSALMVLFQIATLINSASTGTMPLRNAEITFATKLEKIIHIFYNFLVSYLVGPNFNFSPTIIPLLGIAVVTICASFFLISSRQSKHLIYIGISIILFNVLINVFALSDTWANNDFSTSKIPIYRHTILAFFGTIMIVVSLIDTGADFIRRKYPKLLNKRFDTFIFIVWFVLSGYLIYGISLSREPKSPVLNNSQWQRMANKIDTNQTPLCVPLNPWLQNAYWLYAKHCTILNASPSWSNGTIKLEKNKKYTYDFKESFADATIVSAALLLDPPSAQNTLINATIIFTMKTGEKILFEGAKHFTSGKGMILLDSGIDHILNANKIENFTVSLDQEALVFVHNNMPASPGIIWMGR